MASITLTSTYTPNETTIPNIFLDRYMPSANGEFVKVYLCLLRMYANPSGRTSTLTDIADLLNHTEGDIIRAIKYWEKAGLLSVGYDGDVPSSITLLPISARHDGYSETAASAEGVNAIGEQTSIHAADETLPANVTGTGGGVNPRTAIGQRADGAVLLLIIDGRQTHSLGATLNDLINVFLDFDAVNAANLDGGGSTVFYYNGEIYNKISSIYGARGIPTAIVIK